MRTYSIWAVRCPRLTDACELQVLGREKHQEAEFLYPGATRLGSQLRFLRDESTRRLRIRNWVDGHQKGYRIVKLRVSANGVGPIGKQR
jgi:hypothetical protein